MRRSGRGRASARRAVVVAAVLVVASAVPVSAASAPRCAGRTPTIVGTPGHDDLTGTPGDDVIWSGGGDDTIRAGAGDDVVCAGPGADTVAGGDGDDWISGGSGDDDLRGGSGRDTILGLAGNDHIDGRGAADVLSGGAGDDRLTGGNGDDLIRGGDGGDALDGGFGSDRLLGGAGPDHLDGGPHPDVLRGQAGDDLLAGGAEDDLVLGGPDDDTLDGGDGFDECRGGDGNDLAGGCEVISGTEAGQLPEPRTAPSPNAIALTFDDGPHPSYTPRILDILDRYEVKATFFVVGWQVARYPGLLEEIAARGHRIENHTWSHKWLTRYGDATVARELQRLQDEIIALTGTTPRCYRPPYGATSDRVRRVAAGVGLAEVMWDASGADWKGYSARTIASLALRAQGGDVVLLHDGGGVRSNTVAALPSIIEGFLERGLTFETLCE